MAEFVNRNIASPKSLNPDYDVTVVDAEEWQLDVSEPLAIAARTAAAWHIKIMATRREKIVAKISKVNQKAANAISKIPPSAYGMFGGDAAELARHLDGSKHSFQPL